MYLPQLLTSGRPFYVMAKLGTQVWQSFFFIFGMVTVGFLLFDRLGWQTGQLENWDPHKLPGVSRQEQHERWNRLAGFIFGLAAAAFWIWLGWLGGEIDLPGGVHVTGGPMWPVAYWVALAVTLVGAATDLAVFLRPRLEGLRLRARIFCDAAVVLTMAVLLRGPAVLTLSLRDANPKLERLADWSNSTVRISLTVILVISIVDAAAGLYKIWRTGGQLTQVPSVYF